MLDGNNRVNDKKELKIKIRKMMMTMHCDVDDDKGWRKLFDGLLDRSKL